MPNENQTSIEVFHDEADGIESIGLILRHASIVEDEDDLVAGCKLTVQQACSLSQALQNLVLELGDCGH